jgi:L-ascorbate metabolism protein UlaG (beta-lactamase superfamily)
VKHPRDLKHVQVDDIHVKRQGKVIALAMAIIVNTRLWWGGVIARKQYERLIQALVQIIHHYVLARPLLFCVDGFFARVRAVQLVFHSPLPSGKHSLSPADILAGHSRWSDDKALSR